MLRSQTPIPSASLQPICLVLSRSSTAPSPKHKMRFPCLSVKYHFILSDFRAFIFTDSLGIYRTPWMMERWVVFNVYGILHAL